MIRALALALLTLASPALAEEGDLLSGTLKAIRDRGAVRIGTRDAAIPFSFNNRAKQPIGFSVDICRAIAADIARTLNRELIEPGAAAWRSGIRIVFVPTTAEARLPKIIAGDIDLECGSTTANAERAKTVAFSPIFFLAGTKIMTAAPGALSYQDLAGKTIAVSAGTTNADVVRRLSATPPLKIAEAPSLDDAFTMLATNTAQGFASDDILLAGFIATKPDAQRFRVVGEYLSYEPYAIAFRKNDPAFATLVKQTFERLAMEGNLRALYNRWLVQKLPTGETMNLPMSAHLAEMYRALGQPD